MLEANTTKAQDIFYRRGAWLVIWLAFGTRKTRDRYFLQKFTTLNRFSRNHNNKQIVEVVAERLKTVKCVNDRSIDAG